MPSALVIGGSLSGLLAARVLANHFDHVTLLERDTFPDGPDDRNGVPQARHLHILLLKGKDIFEHYFPGLRAELVENGAVEADAGNEFLTISIFGRIIPTPLGLNLLLCSRNLIEWRVRQRMMALPNVQILSQAEATGFLTRDNHQRIYGIQLRARGREAVPEQLTADFIVDASGRTSQTADWLAALGYPRPETTIVNSHLGYATRWYKQPENYQSPWKGIITAVKPPHNPRGGALFPAEGGQWTVTLAGINACYPPTDEAGFLDFARELSDPAIYEAIREAEPLTSIYGYRRTENQWRHYERFDRWPGGFVVMGDAACCFNPVYGQGMTSAAMGAVLLDEQLQAGRDFSPVFGQTFQRKLAKSLETPWLMATGEDFRWEKTEGARPGGAVRFVQGYLDRVIRLATQNPRAGKAFLKVVHLLEPPTSLFHPAILLPALLQNHEDGE
jgi:2-polyprenyl-6-methoxyphenol hydroxylase-like FAD-dependent oxidoreductase